MFIYVELIDLILNKLHIRNIRDIVFFIRWPNAVKLSLLMIPTGSHHVLDSIMMNYVYIYYTHDTIL